MNSRHTAACARLGALHWCVRHAPSTCPTPNPAVLACAPCTVTPNVPPPACRHYPGLTLPSLPPSRCLLLRRLRAVWREPRWRAGGSADREATAAQGVVLRTLTEHPALGARERAAVGGWKGGAAGVGACCARQGAPAFGGACASVGFGWCSSFAGMRPTGTQA